MCCADALRTAVHCVLCHRFVVLVLFSFVFCFFLIAIVTQDGSLWHLAQHSHHRLIRCPTSFCSTCSAIPMSVRISSPPIRPIATACSTLSRFLLLCTPSCTFNHSPLTRAHAHMRTHTHTRCPLARTQTHTHTRAHTPALSLSLSLSLSLCVSLCLLCVCVCVCFSLCNVFTWLALFSSRYFPHLTRSSSTSIFIV
jgi:hypothetical protein